MHCVLSLRTARVLPALEQAHIGVGDRCADVEELLGVVVLSLPAKPRRTCNIV